jgi:HAD superfamily phosphatase
VGGRYLRLADGVAVAEGVADLLPRVDLLVFDVDGVLVDVSASYPRVVSEAVRFYCTRFAGLGGAEAPAGSPPDDPAPPQDGRFVSPEETALFKRAGGFNSDWDLAWAACLFAVWRSRDPGAPSLEAFTAEVRRLGGGPAGARAVLRERASPPVAAAVEGACDRNLIERVCCELYGGDDGCEAMFGFRPAFRAGPGLYRHEFPLVRPEELAPWAGRLAVYTGRNDGETEFALRLADLAELFPPECRVTSSGPWRKPDPGGLRALARRLGARAAIFAGDNVDDCETVLRYREAARPGEAPFLFAGVLGGSPGPAAGPLFAERGADLIVDGVAVLLRVLRPPARA